MASFTLEQVHEQLMDDDSSDLEETSAIQHQDEEPENEGLDEAIDSCLEAFNSLGLGDNLYAFKNHMKRYMVATYRSFEPPSDPLKVLLNTGINCSSIFAEESRSWLQKIYTRLAGKTSIKNPYQAEIVRSIPIEVFRCFKRAITHTRNKEINDNVVLGDNKKKHVISFTSRVAVVSLFSLLSGMRDTEVMSHFDRSLVGRFNGNASIIIDTSKDFAFIYSINSSQLCIAYHYGVWNESGFPLHNTDS